MVRGRRRIPWLLVRIAIYLAAIVVLLLLRGQVHWKQLRRGLTTPPASDGILAVSGWDVAPELLASVVDLHRKDYPTLQVDVQHGGSAQALEALANRRVDVAIVSRPPLVQEQGLFTKVCGDTAEWTPFALSALVVLHSSVAELAAADTAITVQQVRDLVAVAASLSPELSAVTAHLYLPDPNDGTWDALCAAVQQPARDAAGDALRPLHVAFLADAAAVLQTLRGDPQGLGVLSALMLPDAALPRGVRAVSVRTAAGAPAVPPGYENVGGGLYPLFHYLYVVTVPPPTSEATMFVTYLVGERGQRQVERAGFLPAERVARQIHLTKHPVGEHH